jgi:hypothetical protein
VIEAPQIHVQAARVFQKQLWMRAARDQPTGLFLVEILRELASHCGDGTLHIGAAHQYREIAHVRGELLFEVHVQPFTAHLARGEVDPCPVALLLHHPEQCFNELVRSHALA